MKTITFKRYTKQVDLITFTIKDEETFKQKLMEHLQEEGSMCYWNIEEDEEAWGCSELNYNTIDQDEDNDNFFEVMTEHGYPFDEEDIDMLDLNQEEE